MMQAGIILSDEEDSHESEAIMGSYSEITGAVTILLADTIMISM